MKVHLIVVYIVFFHGSSMVAQSIEPDDSFTIELGLPNSFTNEPFKDIMQGLVCVSPYYQYALKSGLAFGIGGHYSYFAVNEFSLPSAVYGGMHTLVGFLKLSHEKFWGERFGTDFGMKFGYAHSMVKTDALQTQGIRLNVMQSTYIEPILGFILTSDEANSYRLTIGYPFYGFGFKPRTIGVDSELGYGSENWNRISSFLTVGFGYTHYFNGKSSGDD
jgi:hypothetical protein